MIMSVDYWFCGMCGVYLMHSNQMNAGRLPPTRIYENQAQETGLIAVRCAACTEMPYLLEEGQPYRVDLIGGDHVMIMVDLGYNYYPLGMGHVFETFTSNPDKDKLTALQEAPIEIGFIVEEDVNLIALVLRRGGKHETIFPYCWHFQNELIRAIPPLVPSKDEDRSFTVAYVNDKGGKYKAIRKQKMTAEFAAKLNKAIHNQIALGQPEWEKYKHRAENVADYMVKNKLESSLVARCVLE
jgi:hypothetical protein